MKLTILGCGSSVGVPSVSCKCLVCTSEHKYNKRLRTSAIIEHKGVKILIDTGPDLREQMLKSNTDQVDGVIYTHAHTDHISGIDDLRAFKPTREDDASIPIYGDKTTLSKLEIRNHYMFETKSPKTTQNKSSLTVNTINYYEKFLISKIAITPFPQEHGEITSSGFIFDNLIAYCTDVKKFPERAFYLLKEIEILVIECLGYKETKAHMNFNLTLEMIKKINPKKAILTHMGHELEFHTLKRQLEEYKNEHNVKTDIIVPYDGYTIQTNDKIIA